MNAQLRVTELPPIIDLMKRFDVADAVAQIEAHPELWNAYTLRTDRYGTPHAGISDIWVRFNDWANYTGDARAFTMEPHESVWYPAAEALPAVVALVEQVMAYVVGESLHGVLITKIPPAGRVLPHVDSGWHAETTEKFAVQLKGNDQQAFCFDGYALSPTPGDLYTFDNSHEHWVTNDSDEDRMTLICCIRR